MNELSKQMGLAKSTMTRIVNNMVREGWIEQVRNRRDRRLVNVQLTRKGKEVAKGLGVSSKDYVHHVLKHLPPEKIPQVIDSLKWIVHSIEKEVKSG